MPDAFGYPRGVQDGGRSRPLSVWRWQFIFALASLMISVVFAVVYPSVFIRPSYIIGAVIVVTATGIAMALPWHRFHRDVIMVLPFLNVTAIGFMWMGTSALGIDLLWMFPVAWVATHFSARWLALLLIVVPVFLLVDVVYVRATTDETLRFIINAVVLYFIGITIYLGAQRNRSAERLLRHQSRQLERALHRVHAQERTAAGLLDALPNGVAQIDIEGNVIASNSAYRSIYDIGDTPEYPAGAVEYRTRRGEVVPLAETTIARAAGGQAIENELVWLFTIDGIWRAVEVTVRTNTDDGDDSSEAEEARRGTVIIVTDVTQAAMARGSRESLARTISHELRNPLAALVGYADLLAERSDLPESANTQVESVSAAADRMERLLTQGLNRPQTDVTDPVQFDLAKVVEASISAFTPSTATSGVTLEQCDLGELLVTGDEFRIRQVVDNVISNGLKYTARGGSVSFEPIREDGVVGVAILDTGVGIDEADVPRIFDPYFRASTASASDVPGTGLGLSIAREIVMHSGGSIHVSSVLSRGTRVELRFTVAAHPPSQIEEHG